MSKCNITIPFKEPGKDFVTSAGNAIKKAGGKFAGGEKQGAFELSTMVGTIKGVYTIQGPEVHIKIENKPLLLSCARIEEELRHYLETGGEHGNNSTIS